MKKKELEMILSKLEQPSKLKVNLEQYPLTSNIAADILYLAYISNEIKGKIIADFGCGNGILGLGAALLSAKKVYLIDIDPAMIDISKKNFEKLKITTPVEFLNIDISSFERKVDLIVQNPPFGSRKKHYDTYFLENALRVSSKVYSIHRYTKDSLKFFEKFLKELNSRIVFSKVYSLPIKKIYDFHKKPVKKIDILLLKIVRNLKNSS